MAVYVLALMLEPNLTKLIAQTQVDAYPFTSLSPNENSSSDINTYRGEDRKDTQYMRIQSGTQ